MPRRNGNGGQNGANRRSNASTTQNRQTGGNGSVKSKNSRSGNSITKRLEPMQNNGGLQNLNANYRKVYSKVDTLVGSDYFGPVVVKALTTTASDKILATIPITPSAYEGTRITQLSNLWERYRFKRFNLRYVSAVPNTLACQLVLYIDTDPTDDPSGITNADVLIRQAIAQTGAQQWNFNMSKTTPLALRNDDQMYYTGVDKQNERFTRMGTAYIIQITDPINFNGSPVTTDLQAGSLFIDWECCFQIPQINPVAALPSPAGVYDVTDHTQGSTFKATGLIPGAKYRVSSSFENASDTEITLRLNNTVFYIKVASSVGVTSFPFIADSEGNIDFEWTDGGPFDISPTYYRLLLTLDTDYEIQVV